MARMLLVHKNIDAKLADFKAAIRDTYQIRDEHIYVTAPDANHPKDQGQPLPIALLFENDMYFLHVNHEPFKRHHRNLDDMYRSLDTFHNT